MVHQINFPCGDVRELHTVLQWGNASAGTIVFTKSCEVHNPQPTSFNKARQPRYGHGYCGNIGNEEYHEYLHCKKRQDGF